MSLNALDNALRLFTFHKWQFYNRTENKYNKNYDILQHIDYLCGLQTISKRNLYHDQDNSTGINHKNLE